MSKVAYADIDVMVNNGQTFYKSLRYPYCPLFRFSIEDLWKFVTDRLPSLQMRTDAKCFIKLQSGIEIEIEKSKMAQDQESEDINKYKLWQK